METRNRPLSPYQIDRVLDKSGISYTRIELEDINQPGIYIVSYWTGAPLLSSLHTVAIKWDEKFKIYNCNTNNLPSEDKYICGYHIH